MIDRQVARSRWLRRPRVTLVQMQKFDMANDTSMVREVEMAQEAMSQPAGYPNQFWRDVELYGIAEAMLYFLNHATSDTTELEDLIDRVLTTLG